MRYVVTGEWNRNDLLRLILALFLVYVFLFWITNWALYFQKMTLDPDTVVRYYRGDPEVEFGRPARPLGAMAEVAHFHVFTMGLLVLTLTHLLLFLPIPVRWKASLVVVAFAAAIVDEGAGWLVRFAHPAFAWLKVAGFLLLQTSLFGLTVALFVGVIRPARNAYPESEMKAGKPEIKLWPRAIYAAVLFGLAETSTAGIDSNSATPPPHEHLAREIRIVMGTALEIAVFHADSALAKASLDAAFAEAMRLEDLLSHYRPETPLSKLNEAAGDTLETDPELVAYLTRSRRDTKRTDGAFDVTVAPLLALYHEGDPGAEELRRALELVGAEKIRTFGEDRVALAPGMGIDPGGDGKGIALDRLVAMLRVRGVERAFLNFGGSSIYGMGTPPDRPSSLQDRADELASGQDMLGRATPTREGWFVAIQDPDGKPLDAVFLRDEALSVSSALPPSPEPEGARRGHIVDPRTGELVLLERTTAVISPWATDGDVLSTALIVEGAKGLRWLARFEATEAIVFEPGGRSASPGWSLHSAGGGS